MARPDRVPIPHPLDIMPHPVAVNQPPAGLLGNRQHPPVDVSGYPGHHPRGRLPQPLRPVPAHQLMVAADPSAGDNHRLGPQGELRDLGDARDGIDDVRCAQYGASTNGDLNWRMSSWYCFWR